MVLRCFQDMQVFIIRKTNKYYDIHKDIDDIIGWSITR